MCKGIDTLPGTFPRDLGSILGVLGSMGRSQAGMTGGDSKGAIRMLNGSHTTLLTGHQGPLSQPPNILSNKSFSLHSHDHLVQAFT